MCNREMVAKINFIWEMRNREIKHERLEVPEFLYRHEGKKSLLFFELLFEKAGTLEPENKQSSIH